MAKTAKKTGNNSNKKKTVSKSSPTSSSQPSPKSIPATPVLTNDATNKLNEEQKEYTPAQIEQAELSRELDQYVTEFQQKQFRLAYQPSEQELVIIFIMNLHPRFRRFVEPDFLSFSNWLHAAAFARLHCTRISAIMGAERTDGDSMFASAESRALIESGYFVSSKSPAAKMYPGAEAIQHLLIPNTDGGKNNQVKSSSSTPVVAAEKLSLPAPVSPKESDLRLGYMVTEEPPAKEESMKGNEKEISHTISNAVANAVMATGQNSWLSTLDNNVEKFMDLLPTVEVTEQDNNNKENTTLPKQEPSTATSISTTDKAVITADNVTTNGGGEPPNNKKLQQQTAATEGESPLTKSAVQARINQAVKTKKEKEKAVAAAIATDNNNNNNAKSICYRLPQEHVGINLAFLELTVNEQPVRGLLAKVRWGSSAISLDCVKRLGLSMKETNNFCIHTDFGYEDTIGILKLPIVHPADPKVKSEMEIQVLPMIYAGKVDLVLGADFFYFFQPTLNIKTRAIRFLDREAPYIVCKIE